MRTDGTMKVAVFEEQCKGTSEREEMLTIANLLGEAANWLRGEVVREVNTHMKKKECHRMYRIMTTLNIDDDDDLDGSVVTLYLHYDDNEKELK